MEKQKPVKKPISMIMWVNHLSLLPGDPSVNISYNAINSGVGGGLTGLVIESTTTGEEAQGGGNKVVQKGLDIPPGFRITGVRVGYENSNVRSFITQVRLAQVQNPPESTTIPRPADIREIRLRMCCRHSRDSQCQSRS